ncbi:ATP-binding protein [Aquabacterium sp. OR-4]|uniref:ATP-binding protein n=1 Tax=Aquabacterium sp. OR-4 TaxID=2978127 RepID=UPI0021B23C2B|nr:ATP-binding protein [Aquabacterium sp. OR-4]MDT7836621.1 ATP-binding protein [Aquabacterium sp. OR-4]
MKSLYLRIWLTVVAALALFALVSGWMWQRHIEDERSRFEQVANDRLAAWAELVQRSLPGADAPAEQQAEALREWSQRLRVPMALDDAGGRRIAASESFARRAEEGGPMSVASVRLDDGRTLLLTRRSLRRPLGGPPPEAMLIWSGRAGAPNGPGGPGGPGGPEGPPPEFRATDGSGPSRNNDRLFFGLPRAVGPLALVAVLFVAVAAGAYPVVRRLTRRLEALKQGVEAFGGGNLGLRVDASGRDEVAAVASSFNQTAARIETLVNSHKSLLANASHELRSPLARLKMAVAMLGGLSDTSPAAQRASLSKEIDTNIRELDALVEEVLLASRLDASGALERDEQVDLLGIAVEEAARVGAEVAVGDETAEAAEAQAGDTAFCVLPGSDRLLRRALRNLVENAHRYGGQDVAVRLAPLPGGGLALSVSDRGPGVPPEYRERIFEPFFRLPGHAEQAGGVGLGLSLVRQIAQRHGGSVRCEAREGGGSRFVLSLPRH